MSTVHRFVVSAIFLWVILFLIPTGVSAYNRETRLDYNGQLFGYTTTWKEPWDEDVGGDCANWVWDPEYEEWYCESWLMWENYVLTRGWLYGPGGLYASGSAEDRWQAGFNVNPFTPDGPGTWELDGNHYRKQYLYQDDGFGWVLIGVDEYLLFQTAAIVTIQPPPPPCTPSLYGPLLYHRFAFTSNPLWSGFANTVRDAAAEWRSFVWNYTTATAFLEGSPVSLTLELANLGPGIWGQTSNSQDVIWLNPDIFNYSYYFSRGVAMHEFGHARGYADVVSPCPVTDSIMYTPADPNGVYPSQFGPGDSAAAARDIP